MMATLFHSYPHNEARRDQPEKQLEALRRQGAIETWHDRLIGVGEAIIIPVILRAYDWQWTPFGKLNAAPPYGSPAPYFADRDQAMLEVARTVRRAAEKVDGRRADFTGAGRRVPNNLEQHRMR